MASLFKGMFCYERSNAHEKHRVKSKYLAPLDVDEGRGFVAVFRGCGFTSRGRRLASAPQGGELERVLFDVFDRHRLKKKGGEQTVVRQSSNNQMNRIHAQLH